ncbi:MAG: hypothetical protein IKJ31_04540 [Bacteroidaceae bacterium]|nr:hypothetical protein [Bacteroidaceae bacterium]
MYARKASCFILIILGLNLSIGTNAQSRLYPKGRDNSECILNRYYAKIDSLLLNNRELDDFAFTIRPSFTGEQGCYYVNESAELVLKVAKKSIWYSKEAKINEYRHNISRNTAKLLKELFSAAVFSSSYLAQPNGLDGVTYEILINGGYYTAECWSPQKDTNCHKLVKILEELSTAIIANDQSAVEDLIPEIKELTEDFKKLYPEDVK